MIHLSTKVKFAFKYNYSNLAHLAFNYLFVLNKSRQNRVTSISVKTISERIKFKKARKKRLGLVLNA